MTGANNVVDGKRIIAKPQVEDQTVKSAGRALAILEYFDDVKRAATVMEIAGGLGYPQSSTSALLKSLVALGYLHHDPHERTYITSSRVALLGNWVNPLFYAEGAIISMMKELNEETGDTIMLGVRLGLTVQYIHVIQATNPTRLHMTLGNVRPLAASGAGYAILSTLPDAEVRQLVMRINAEAEDGAPVIRIRDLLVELAAVRKRGYALTFNMVTRGGGILAMPLPRVGEQPLMMIGIGGVSEVMRSREAELAETLQRKVSKYFGVLPTSEALRR